MHSESEHKVEEVGCQLRAVELLEGTACPAAKDLLSELAKGAAGVPLTLEAAAALGRLARR